MKLLDYIQGLRKGKEAHRLEKESMKDPFLADALDGFGQVKGNHASTIEQLQKQIAARASRQSKRMAWGWSVAACLLVGVGMGSYFFLFPQNDSEAKELEVIAESAPVVRLEDTLASHVEQDTVRVIVPKRDYQRDRIAKAQEAPAAEESVMEIEESLMETEEAQEVQDELQIKTSATTRAYAKLAQPAALKDKVLGKVIDEKGEPVAGAYIYYKGTDIGTITNIDGEFALEKNTRNNELTAQFIGYKSVDMPIDTNRNMLIALNEDKTALSEVVVVGYEMQKKSTLTGASARLNQSLNEKAMGVSAGARTKRGSLDHAESGRSVPVIGKKKFKEYLKENLIRPTDEACKDCKGKVTVTFFVDSNGNPQHILVTQSLCESADKEAVRLIQEGPKWTTSELRVTVEVQF